MSNDLYRKLEVEAKIENIKEMNNNFIKEHFLQYDNDYINGQEIIYTRYETNVLIKGKDTDIDVVGKIKRKKEKVNIEVWVRTRSNDDLLCETEITVDYTDIWFSRIAQTVYKLIKNV